MAERPNTFILSRNRSKSKPEANPKWPDFRGEATIEVDGKLLTFELAAWIREKRADQSKFFSGSIKLKVPKATETPAEGQEPKAGNAFEDDPPFG